MENEKINVVIKRVGQPPEETEIANTLKSLQTIVGGIIEMPSMPGEPRVKLVCNESGKIDDLPFNVLYGDDILCGDIVAVSVNDDGDTVGLSKYQAKKAMQYFAENSIADDKKPLSVNPENSMDAKEQQFLDRSLPMFGIYQLKNREDLHNYRFESLDSLTKNGQKADRNNYNFIYAELWSDSDTLDDIYTRFNINHPKDFTGHSLSVSDIIVINKDGQLASHYVDSFGFKIIPDFITNKERLSEFADINFNNFKQEQLSQGTENIFNNAFKINFYTTMHDYLTSPDHRLNEKVCHNLCSEGSYIIDLLYDEFIDKEYSSINNWDDITEFIENDYLRYREAEME